MSITAEYTGKWPNACRGSLIIKRDDVKIYEISEYSFESGGECYFTNGYENSHVNDGPLIFNEDKKIEFMAWALTQFDNEEIVKKVEEEIDCFGGCCCGGCL